MKINQIILYSSIHLLSVLVVVLLTVVVLSLYPKKNKRYNENVKIWVTLTVFCLIIFSFYLFPHLLVGNRVPPGFNDGASHYTMAAGIFRTWPVVPKEHPIENIRIWAPIESKEHLLALKGAGFYYPFGFQYIVVTIAKVSGVKLETVYWFLPMMINAFLPVTIFLFVSYFFKSKHAGLLAAFLMGTTPFFLRDYFYGQYPYLFSVLLLPLCIYVSLIGITTRHRMFGIILSGLLLSFLILTHSIFALLPVLFFFGFYLLVNLFFRQKSEIVSGEFVSQTAKRFLIILVVAGLVSLPHLIKVIPGQWEVHKRSFLWGPVFPSYQALFEEVNYVSLILLLVSVFSFVKHKTLRKEFLIMFFTLVSCWLVFQTEAFGSYFGQKKFFGYSLLFISAVSSFWLKSYKKIFENGRLSKILVTLLLITLVQLGLCKHRFLPSDINTNEEFRAILWMRDNLPSEAKVLTTKRNYTWTAAASSREVKTLWYPSEEIVHSLRKSDVYRKITPLFKRHDITHIFISASNLPYTEKVEMLLWDLPFGKVFETESVRIYKVE